MKFPRLAARGVIVEAGRLLLVNAYPGGQSDLWCAPGGGAEVGQSLPETVAREVLEETGLRVDVGGLLGVNEFHRSDGSFHQIDLYFRATVTGGTLAMDDPEGIVNRYAWVTEAEMAGLRVKPDTLARMAFRGVETVYDPLEEIVS
ncbi:MAG: NUDIX domain-containing protein [Pseudomonadota bacterium]